MVPMPFRDRSAGRAPAAHSWAWAFAMLGSVLLLVAVYGVFVTTSTGQLAEHVAVQAAETRLQSLRGPGLAVLRWLPQIVGALAVATFLVVTVWRRRWLASLIAVAVFGAANVTTQLLKNVLLVRPELDNGVPYLTGNSLPSGHTTFAAAAAVAVFLVVAPRWRPATAALGAVFATAVGAGAFIETWHRPADMVAAYLVAAFWGLVGGYAILRTGAEWNTVARRQHDPSPAGSPLWEVALWLGGLALTAGVWLSYEMVGGLDALSADRPWNSGWHYLGGLLASTGPGLLVFAALATFFRLEVGRAPALTPPGATARVET